MPEKETDRNDVIYLLWSAQNAIEEFNSSIYSSYMYISRPAADALLATLRDLSGRPEDEKLSKFHIFQLKHRYNEYRIAFTAELAALNSYFVTHKLPFDASALLTLGESLFPINLSQKSA